MPPEIVEHYCGWKPTVNLRTTVIQLLNNVPPTYLEGLGSVVLTSAAGLSSKRRREKTRSRHRKVRVRLCNGLYHRAWEGDPAWVELFIDNIFEGVPGWAMRVPVVRALFLESVLFHEIGHHIHQTKHRTHRGAESSADYWKRRLRRASLRNSHPLLWPFLRLIALAARPILERVVSSMSNSQRPRE